MTNLTGQGGELRATVHVTRKETGKVETYEIVGNTTPEQHEQISKDIHEQISHGTSGALVGQGSILTKQEN